MKIDKSVQMSLIFAVAAIIMVFVATDRFSGSSGEQTITVDGISEVSVMPDLVSVTFNVETLEKSANVAKDNNAEIMAKVKEALIAEGFSRDDFETQNFNVYEEFDWSKEERTSLGFKATHSMIVRIDAGDEAMIGKAIDAAVNNGAMLSYVNFELSQSLENEYKAKALKMAAEDAKIKGEAVALGLGAELGDVVSTTMGSDFRYYPMMAYDNAVGGAVKGSEVATNIQVGEQKVSAQISVTYELD